MKSISSQTLIEIWVVGAVLLLAGFFVLYSWAWIECKGGHPSVILKLIAPFAVLAFLISFFRSTVSLGVVAVALLTVSGLFLYWHYREWYAEHGFDAFDFVWRVAVKIVGLLLAVAYTALNKGTRAYFGKR